MKLLTAALLVSLPLLADDFSTSTGTLTITPIQHASFMIQAGGRVVYVDPAQGSYDGRPKADLILITDIHGDHMAPKIVDSLRKPSTVVLAPEGVAKSVTGCKIMRNGETMQEGDWKLEAVPMYNLKRGPSEGKFYHDKGRGNGYVLTYGGKRFYISGDTEGIPEMRGLKNIDVAFVCMNLPYTMTPEEAADAVRAFHPKIVYAYHSRGSDVKVFEKGLEGSGVEVRQRNWYPG
jgi:L-ascorbate metabolism protein UlaG (beta-lactamase superfamily)